MVSSEEETETKPGDTVEWTVDMEIQLFYAMAHLKPLGISKHLHMACIWENLSNSITSEITTNEIWRHLNTLYDMQLLEDTEPIPFPNNEVHFSLSDNEFGHIIKQKCKDIILADDIEDARSSSPKTTTPRSSSRAATPKDVTPKGTRKDSLSGLAATKTRKESGSSHASTDTPSIKSEKDYDRRRDSRDSNASGPRDGSSSRKSLPQKEKAKTRISSVTAWGDSPAAAAAAAEEEGVSRRGRRRTNASTPPAVVPAKRRRT